MSDRYEYCAYVVTDTVTDTHVGFASNIPNAMRLTKELNALQDVIDIAHRYYKLNQQTSAVLPSKDATIWDDLVEANGAFESAMRALTPKTVEQLLQERLEAADLVIQIINDCQDQGDLIAAATEYDKSTLAYLKAVQS
jgi:hypothetical protein